MKRFFDDEGGICCDPALKKAEKLLQESFQAFVDAGYLHRDFFQFADLESSLCMCDFELDMMPGDSNDFS